MRLIASGLAGKRGGEPVFDAVSFELCDSEALVVTGPNGAGKSTLLRVVAGLLPAAAGSVRLEAGEFPVARSMLPEGSAQLGAATSALQQVDGEHHSIASVTHYLGHRDAMKPALSVSENLSFWRNLLGGGGLSAAAALDSVGLAGIGDAPFAYLSAGQKRRAALARLLVAPRPIWLLDEPSAGLDAASEARLAELMQAHRASGGIILAATHQPLGLEPAQQLRLGGASLSPLRGGSLRDGERGGGAAG